jgi:nucleotide-binding universal stress UspA family protein
MKILWALNAFDTDKQPLRTMAGLLRTLAGGDKPIQAVYIANHAEQQLMLAFDVPLDQRFSSYPFGKLQQATAQTGLGSGEVNEEVIYEPSTSMKKAADRLVEAARERKSALIATYTHGRKGLERFFLGSFAETLLHRSPLPILLVRPGTRPIRTLRVLFATDATAASRKAFVKLLAMLPAECNKVVVYHLGEPTKAWGTAGQLEEKKQRQRTLTELDRYVTLGKEKGVAVKVVSEFDFAAPAEAIQAAAEKQKANLLVVAAQKGALEGALIGSTTRKLIRESELPVLVLKA